jgi:hypothetical protein
MIEKEHVITDREFTVLAPADAAHKRITSYLEGAGYRQIEAEPLTFERGTKFGTPFAFTPKKWHSVVVVGVSGTGEATSVKATFDIDKTGQLISAREALFWDNEIAGLESAVKGQVVTPGGSAQASIASRENVLSVGVLLVWLVVAAAAVFAIYVVLPQPLRPVGRLVLPIGAIWIGLRLWSRFQGRLDTKATA